MPTSAQPLRLLCDTTTLFWAGCVCYLSAQDECPCGLQRYRWTRAKGILILIDLPSRQRGGAQVSTVVGPVHGEGLMGD